MRRSALTVAAAVSAVTLSALSAGVATASGAPPSDEHGSEPTLASGRAAIDSLGDRLPAAARRLDLPAAALRHILLTDSTAQLDSEGNLTFVEPTTAHEHEAGEAESSPAEAAAAAGPSYPLDQTFALHSKPGSPRVIYLDFTGYDLTGTVWSKPENGSMTGNYQGYSTDADFTTFSDQELAEVQRIWQHAAADYAALDVDVTTADPGAAAMDRASASDTTYGTTAFITSDPAVEQQMDCDCGGKAWHNAFDRQPDHRYLQPAIILEPALANAHHVGQIVSHEVGHTLGLSHDGKVVDGVNTEYYTGPSNTLWSPIMGTSFYHPVSTWSLGEYPNANNQQDDFAVMASHGLLPRSDEAGDTTAAAALGTSSGSRRGSIGSRTDKDVYAVDWACASTMTTTAMTVALGSNLDIGLRLLNAQGTPVAGDNPPAARVSSEVASGLGASITQALTPGRYYLEVDGVGAGTQADGGYSDYASVGTYTLTTTGCAAPTTVMNLTTVVDQITATATTSWAAPSADGGAPVSGYRVTIGTRAPVMLPASARAYAAKGLPRGRTVAIKVESVNAAGAGAPAASSALALPVAGPVAIRLARLDNAVRATWPKPSTVGKAPITGYRIVLRQANHRLKRVTVGSATRARVFRGLSQGQRYRVVIRAMTGSAKGPAARSVQVRPL